jgi:hypothetical protein
VKLISESWEQVEVLKEETGGGYFFTGVTIQANIVNKNNRRYPLDVVENEIARYTNEKILRKNSYGELDHPDTPKINMDRVGHYFTEIRREGNNFVSKAKLLNNGMGNIVKSFLDEGCAVGISSRSLGSVKESAGVQEVQDDLYIVTPGDIVADPSAPEAFVKGLKEGVEYAWLDGELVEQVVKRIDKNYKAKMNFQEKREVFLREFKIIVNHLGGK